MMRHFDVALYRDGTVCVTTHKGDDEMVAATMVATQYRDATRIT